MFARILKYNFKTNEASNFKFNLNLNTAMCVVSLHMNMTSLIFDV